jgi:hypothetical protein
VLYLSIYKEWRIILAGTQFERFFLITEEGANSAQRAQRQNTHLPVVSSIICSIDIYQLRVSHHTQTTLLTKDTKINLKITTAMNSALLAYICILSIGYCLPVLDAFVPNVHVHVDVRKHTRTIRTNPLYAANKDEKNKSDKKGYQFGDITKNLISKVTKKDDYEFGDLSKSIDKTVKDKVATMSGKDKDSYEFGDLSRLVDSRVKEQVNDFTNQTSYKFGDVSKEILVRVKTRDYTMDDMIILFKILLAFGAGLSPVASFLPAKLLIELLDYSILGDLSNKVTTAITQELDQRMKKAFTGDADYQLGDMSKKAVLKYIGKDE